MNAFTGTSIVCITRCSNIPCLENCKVCKCSINQIPYAIEDENIMECQAIGIASRILMQKATFIEAARQFDITYGKDNWQAIYGLVELFNVSKQSVMIRLKECN